MFVFEDDYTFEWPVTVRYPAAGGEDVREFTGLFRMPEDELEVYREAETLSIVDVITAVRERISKYWIGWSDIEVKEGGALPFSPENRAMLLAQRPVREAVDRALSEAILGIREKN